MKQYSLKIVSKNEKSLKSFLHFFFHHLKTRFNIIQELTATHKSKKVLTILKSPHVNKTAQEQFETRTFSKQLLTKDFSLEKNLIFLKKILSRLFQDISISLKFITNKNTNSKNRLLTLYPDSFKLFLSKPHTTNLKREKQKNQSKQVKLEKKYPLFNLTQFLHVISAFGEIVAINNLEYF